MPDSKFPFRSARAVIQTRVLSLLRATPKIVLPTALATRSISVAQAFAATWTLFPALSSRFIALLNRRSHLPRAKAIYYPLC
jgi:hypothetical protein